MLLIYEFNFTNLRKFTKAGFVHVCKRAFYFWFENVCEVANHPLLATTGGVWLFSCPKGGGSVTAVY